MNIEVSDQTAELTLAFKEHTTMDNMVTVMHKGLNAVYDHLKEIGTQPAGAPYAAYINVNESEDFADFDLEVGFPVADEVSVKDGLFMSTTHQGKAVTAMHKGSYTTLEETYMAVMNYIGENSLEPTGTYYDYYLNDPSVTPEDELLTKVVIPVK